MLRDGDVRKAFAHLSSHKLIDIISTLDDMAGNSSTSEVERKFLLLMKKLLLEEWRKP
jgi:hypothetical protein